MPFSEIRLSRSAVINLGDYENRKAEVVVTYTVEPGETIEAATEKTVDAARTLLAHELEPTLARLSTREANRWRGLLGIPEPVVAVPDEDEAISLNDPAF